MPSMPRGEAGGAAHRNPYLNRVMIREARDFFGRRREVAKIFARIGASRPQSVAIVGERRIGKSSLLAYLCHEEIRRQFLDAPESYSFVFTDLQEQRDIGIPAFFEDLFQGMERALGRPRPSGLTADYEGVRRAVHHFQREGRKIILLFDEFDAITRNANFPEEFFAFLRALANKYDVAYITTSGRDLQQLCHTERIADSPFFNIFSNLFLTRFEPEEALELIREPSETAGLPLAPHAPAILDLAGLLPFFLQVACAAVFEHLAEGGPLDLERVRSSFHDEAAPHFNYIWEHFDDDQRAIVGDLAAGRAVPPSKTYLLTRLRRDGYLVEQDGRERLFSSAFARWLTEAPSRSGLGPSRTPAPAAAEEPAVPSEYPPKPGDRLSHFRILEPLAQGGMSLLFAAEDVRLKRPVVLKVLPPGVFRDRERKRRFLQEARAASALNHANIAVVHEVDEVGDITFIAMERIDGDTLRQRLAAGPLPLADLVRIVCEVADALGAAHARGIVHRDIKPENLMIARDGRVKVLDFGVAKFTSYPNDEAVTQPATAAPMYTMPGSTVGTLAYMSPEQVSGESVDYRADIFSLGVVLYEMATGRPPFGGRTTVDTLHAILHKPVDRTDLQQVTPAALQPILACALEKDPARRYQSMAELAAELQQVGTRSAPEPARSSLRDRLRGWFS